MFPGMGCNINFEHTRVTTLTEKQVFLERVSNAKSFPLQIGPMKKRAVGGGGEHSSHHP